LALLKAGFTGQGLNSEKFFLNSNKKI